MSEIVWIIVLWTLIFMWSIFALMTLAISSLREKHKKKPNVSAKGKIKAHKHKHEWELVGIPEKVGKDITLIKLNPKAPKHKYMVWCKYCGKINKKLTEKYEKGKPVTIKGTGVIITYNKEKENGKIVH